MDCDNLPDLGIVSVPRHSGCKYVQTALYASNNGLLKEEEPF
jgi:hypothetical protein